MQRASRPLPAPAPDIGAARNGTPDAKRRLGRHTAVSKPAKKEDSSRPGASLSSTTEMPLESSRVSVALKSGPRHQRQKDEIASAAISERGKGAPMTDELEIIASVAQPTMASTWTEYLCLHRTSGKWCVDIRGYELIGKASDYEDEEGKLNLPDQIDGREVVGIDQDGYVTVNNLVLHSDSYPVYEFDTFDENEFDDLFRPEYAEWRRAETKQRILHATRRNCS